MPDRLFTAYQVADLLGVTPTEVAQWIQKGWLPYQRLPEGPVRIRERGLVQFLRERGIDLEAILAKTVAREKQQPAAAAAPQPAAAPAEKPASPMTQTIPAGMDRFAPFDWSALPASSLTDAYQAVARLDVCRPDEPVDSLPAAAPAETLPEPEPQPLAEPDEPVYQDELLSQPSPEPQSVEPVVTAVYTNVSTYVNTPAPTPAPEYQAPAWPAGPADTLEKLVSCAFDRRAGQILIQQANRQTTIRLRIDGLYAAPQGDLDTQALLTLLAQIDALCPASSGQAEFRTRLAGRDRCLSVVCCPTREGRRVTIDLESSAPAPTLDELALMPESRRSLQALTDRSAGMIVFAGPAAAGRHTLIHALASRLQPGRDVVALAGPRWHADLTQLSPAADLDLAIAQRPDVILLDRPDHAALAALAAAADRCIVLAACDDRSWSTLAPRLSPHSSALSAVILQRLVRKLCPHCRLPMPPAQESPLLEQLGLGQAGVVGGFKAAGCSQCSNTGYAGRMIIDCLLEAQELDRALAQPQTSAIDRNLIQAGLDKVRQGQTSLAELLRVTRL